MRTENKPSFLSRTIKPGNNTIYILIDLFLILYLVRKLKMDKTVPLVPICELI